MQQNTKDWLQYSSAILMLVSAVVIAFVSLLAYGTVVGGVLIYVAEALVFAAGVFGLSIYFKNQLGEFESNTKRYIDEKIENR